MAKVKAFVYREKKRIKRKGVHSKNASRGGSGWKKKNRGRPSGGISAFVKKNIRAGVSKVFYG